MDALNVGLVQRPGQDAVLQCFDFVMDGLGDRLVVLRDEVQQRIQHEIFAMLQQQWPCLATLAHQAVGLGMALTRGDDITLAGEDMGLDELQPAVFTYWRVSDDEQRITEGIQLRSAVDFQSVFDGQFMQIELLFQYRQFGLIRLLKTNPDKMPRLCSPGGAFVEGDIGHFLSGTVNRSGNDSAHGGIASSFRETVVRSLARSS